MPHASATFRVERPDRSNLDRFVAGGADDERGAPLAVEGEHAIVHLPGQQHGPVEVDRLVVAHAESAVVQLALRPFHP